MADAPEGGNSPANTPAPGTPPPSARTVNEGAVTESNLEIQAELEMARNRSEQAENRIKKLETDLSYLQEENRRLKTIPSPTVHAPRNTPSTFFEED